MTKNTTNDLNTAKKSKAATNTIATKPTPPTTRNAAGKATNARKSAKDATRANDAPHTPTVPIRRTKKAPKLSAMKAAVYDASDQGMRTKDMVEAMGKQGLWTSPAGKTPEATLYAGITREIAKKGNEARFVKVSKGRFMLR